MQELRRKLNINGEDFLLAVSQYGEGPPASGTLGKPGVLYLETKESSERLYICTAANVEAGVYTWRPIEELLTITVSGDTTVTPGADGEDGITPHIGENGNWYLGDYDTGVKAAGADGENGGYYTPKITQAEGSNTFTVEFEASKEGMPAVTPATIKLPEVSNDSGENATAYTDLTNKPSINGVTLEGNKTAEELGITGLTGDQVRTALDDYIADNPDAITTGATPEQVTQINTNVGQIALLGETDKLLLSVIESSLCHEIDLDTMIPAWTNDAYYYYDPGTPTDIGKWGGTDHRRHNSGYIHLQRGDILLTNADAPAATNNKDTHPGIVLWKAPDKTMYPLNPGTAVMLGRGRYDGVYRAYQAQDDNEYLCTSYKYQNIDYEVKFIVVRAMDHGTIPVPFDYTAGYITATTGEIHIQDETNKFASGYNTEVVSRQIDVSAPCKFLLVTNVKLAGSRGAFCWATYAEDGTMERNMPRGRWPSERNYYIIPLVNETEHIRIGFIMGENPYQYTKAYVVDQDYLVRNGYANKLAGATFAAFGDSYVYGHSIGPTNTWTHILAERNSMLYTMLGTNGIGFAQSPNIVGGLIDKVADITEHDYIVVIGGRNDWNNQVPIGTNDNVTGPDVYWGDRTFKGALNWLCSYLCDTFPGKKVFFVTPWFFPDDADKTITAQEYIDALLEITGLWGIPCFDAARRSGIHVRSEAFRSQYFLSADDHSHLNYNGALLFEPMMESYMLAL